MTYHNRSNPWKTWATLTRSSRPKRLNWRHLKSHAHWQVRTNTCSESSPIWLTGADSRCDGSKSFSCQINLRLWPGRLNGRPMLSCLKLIVFYPIRFEIPSCLFLYLDSSGIVNHYVTDPKYQSRGLVSCISDVTKCFIHYVILRI